MPKKEPLIDIIETRYAVSVIVVMPGIRYENLWFKMGDGILVVEITKFGQVYKKAAPCSLKDELPPAKSMTICNSVLELAFEKKHAVVQKDQEQTIS